MLRVGLVALLGVVPGCSNHVGQPAKAVALTADAQVESIARVRSDAGSVPEWTYYTARDKTRIAKLASVNTIALGAPPSYAVLVLRGDDSVQAKLVLENHMFDCKPDGCFVTAKFDAGEIESIAMRPGATDAKDALLFADSQAFVSRLRHAKHLVVEAELFNRGPVQLEFEVPNPP